MSYGCSTCYTKLGSGYSFFTDIFLGYKTFYTRGGAFRYKKVSSGGSIFEECREKSLSLVRYEAIPVSFGVRKNSPMERHIKECLSFDINCKICQ